VRLDGTVRLDGAQTLDKAWHDVRHDDGRQEGKAEVEGVSKEPPHSTKPGLPNTQRSILSEFDRCSSTLLIDRSSSTLHVAKRTGESDTGRTGRGDDTARSDFRSENLISVRALPSSARALPRLLHAPLPTYSPSKEYSSLSARAKVEDADGAASPRITPRSPRAGFLSPLKPPQLDTGTNSE
jgi:hypothetical protein